MSKEYTLRISKADNGWVIYSGFANYGALSKSQMVVKDDEDLAGCIAAALVADRLAEDEPPKVEKAQSLFAGQAATGTAIHNQYMNAKQTQSDLQDALRYMNSYQNMEITKQIINSQANPMVIKLDGTE